MTVKESDILSFLSSSSRGRKAPYIIEGVDVQDDCAVLEPDPNAEICVTTDFVRGTGFHLFKTGHLNLRDVGWYVVAANVSDLCAMGARPICYLSIVRYLNSRTRQEIVEILEGIDAACNEFGVALVGGDTGTYEADVLAGTAIGYVSRGARLSRHTLRAGDALYVSGDVGRPSAALSAVINGAKLEESEKQSNTLNRLLERWRRPTPRIKLGQALSAAQVVTSCMDISDGLTASLLQLRQITGFGFDVLGSAIPIDWSVITVARALGKNAFDIACGASVDFELLFTAAEAAEGTIIEIGKQTGLPVVRIGTVRHDNKLRFTTPEGETRDHLPGIPWDHQYVDINQLFRV